MRSVVLVTVLCVCGMMTGPKALGQVTGQAAGQQAAEGPVPEILIAGLDAYRTGGMGQAMRAWLRNSALEGSKQAIAAGTVLHQAQEIYGNYRGFEPITIRDVTASTRIVYLALDYDRGPVFAKFVTYRTDQGWVMIGLLCSTDDTAVLPVVY